MCGVYYTAKFDVKQEKLCELSLNQCSGFLCVAVDLCLQSFQRGEFLLRPQEFEKFNMPLIIYNSEEIDEITTNKYGSSIDILPTILNLFGVDYDSRLLMGKDIFSDNESLVIFSNRSFITDKGRYNSTVETFEGKEIEDDFIDKKKKEIYYKYRYSRLILKNNFYN